MAICRIRRSGCVPGKARAAGHWIDPGVRQFHPEKQIFKQIECGGYFLPVGWIDGEPAEKLGSIREPMLGPIIKRSRLVATVVRICIAGNISADRTVIGDDLLIVRREQVVGVPRLYAHHMISAGDDAIAELIVEIHVAENRTGGAAVILTGGGGGNFANRR